MRSSLLLAVCIASGCATNLQPVSNVPAPRYAVLTVRHVADRPNYELNGIVAVDRLRLNPHRDRIYIAEGRRLVTYECPGAMSVDMYPQLEYKFRGGTNYELICEEIDGKVVGKVRSAD